jgi:hypothetical protein
MLDGIVERRFLQSADQEVWPIFDTTLGKPLLNQSLASTAQA